MRALPLVSRRLLEDHEWRLSASLMSQPVDIDVYRTDRAASAIPGLNAYATHSLSSAVDWMRSLQELGLRRFVVRMHAGSLETAGAQQELLDGHLAGLQFLRAELGEGMELAVDPFSIALNADGTWGVKQDGVLSAENTSVFIHRIATTMAQAGADAILTLGRCEDEVQVTADALAGSQTKIWSFSSNTETRNAYVYSSSGSGRDTGQKILVGNTTEMCLRALLDVADGTDAVIVKPVENLHVISTVRQLLDDERMRGEFLDSAAVKRIRDSAPHLSEAIERLRSIGALPATSIGTYTVSGTTSTQDMVRRERGPEIALALVTECLLGALSAAQGRIGPMIDRSAHLWVRATGGEG